MRADIAATLNDPALIEVREYHMNRLEALFDGRTLGKPFKLSGFDTAVPTDPAKEPEKWARDILTKMYEHVELILDREVFRPLCPSAWLYGVHFTDKVFGADVIGRDGLFWTDGLKCEIGELPVPDLQHNETWRQAQRITEALVAENVSLPFYSTQVLGEPWNQIFNLYRERGLMAFYDNPEGIRRDLEVMTETLMQMHRWFIDTIPPMQFQPIVPTGRCQPRGYGQMCGCSTHLISGEIYDEFIRPLDERILSLYPHGGMLHLCGSHTQHAGIWAKMPCIRALQLNDRATEDVERYLHILRPDQILYICPTDHYTPEKCLEITGGQRSVLCVSE